MEINYIAVLGASVVAMVIGGLWYSPLLFGKKWMELNGLTVADYEVNKSAKNKEMMRAMISQFFLTLFQAYILVHFIKVWSDVSPLVSALLIYAAFVIPTIAGGILWGGESRKAAFTRFFLQAGNQLVTFAVFAVILGGWG